MKVSEIMSVGVRTVRPGTPAATARERMRTKKIRHLLVMEGAELLGVLSAGDLPDLHYRVPHKKQHRAGGSW